MQVLRYIHMGPLLVVIGAAIVVAWLVAARVMRTGDRDQAIAAVARVLLVGAVLAVIYVTMLGKGGSSGGGVNLVPFRGIREQLHNVNHQLGFANIAGNAFMFVPIGFLLVPAARLRFLRTVGLCLALSLAIESAQLLLGTRSADIDDVMLNTVGGALGALLGLGVTRWLVRASVVVTLPPPDSVSPNPSGLRGSGTPAT